MPTEKRFTFGFLTTIDNPLLPLVLSEALANGCDDIIIICDQWCSSEEDKRAWQKRSGLFEITDGDNAAIYNFRGLKIPLYFVKNHNNRETLSIISHAGINCLFNSGTPRKLNAGIIHSCAYGVINIHPGLLPEYRGCTVVEWAIYNDDKIGNTAHFMDEGYDTGPIITSEWYNFPKDADYQSIGLEVICAGSVLAGKVLGMIRDSKLQPSDAIAQEREKAKHWEPITDEKMELVIQKLKRSKYRYQSQ